jgi:RES domain-containing protein
MLVWRVGNYATLDGVGGLFASGRWHSRGHPVVYCAENAAIALLETLVPHTRNFPINPLHPDSSRIDVVERIEHPLDQRLVV